MFDGIFVFHALGVVLAILLAALILLLAAVMLCMLYFGSEFSLCWLDTKRVVSRATQDSFYQPSVGVVLCVLIGAPRDFLYPLWRSAWNNTAAGNGYKRIQFRTLSCGSTKFVRELRALYFLNGAMHLIAT